ncbi:hypothetical protein FRZ59_04320 [Anseongella ginsenosidimutans]|nr:hypothetical protein FRZ59_04320 [Anseongella ginsenosidimutans]
MLAPVLLLAGVLLRIQFSFFFPDQLAAYESHPALIFASYSAFLAGNILLWPAVITLARLIGLKKPGWGIWGGVFVLFGLFARTFHAGVDHLAFQLVDVQGLQPAIDAVSGSYGAFHIVSVLTGTIMLGWILLAAGAYLSGTLGLIRAIALALMSALMLGVLKGSTVVSVIATAGLCIAMCPLGIRVLHNGQRPAARAVLAWSAAVALVIILLYFFGQAG